MKPLTREWIEKAEADWMAAVMLSHATPRRPKTFHDQIGFHCQQAAEKYLKALLQESGLMIPRIHDLVDLLALFPPVPTLRRLQRVLPPLTRFAVGFRYPGLRATKRQAQAAIRHAEKVRTVVRQSLGLGVGDE